MTLGGYVWDYSVHVQHDLLYHISIVGTVNVPVQYVANDNITTIVA